MLGGGVTGLTACYRLLRASEAQNLSTEIHLIEASPRLGGIIETEFVDGVLMEKGPDCFLTSKPEGVELCQELGLENEIISTNERYRRSFVLRGDNLLPVPQGFYLLAPYRIGPFLMSPIFSPLGKLRMAMDVLLPRRKGDADESLADFVRRRFGREALERMAQPMVAGIYSADPEKLSLKATMPQFHEIEREHGSLILGLRIRMQKRGSGEGASASGPRYGLFVSFERGMGVLVDALAAKISAASVRTGCKAEALERKETGWRVHLQDGEQMDADAVCVTLPPRATGRMLEKIAPGISRELMSIPSGSLATLNLVYRAGQVANPLDAMGFVAPAIENKTLLACSFSSTKFVGRAPEGKVLIRAFAGGDEDASHTKLTDGDLTRKLIDELLPILGISGEPEGKVFYRYEESLPQYLVGHLEKVRRIENELEATPGLALAGNAYHGVGIPDCVKSANEAADKILDDLRAINP